MDVGSLISLVDKVLGPAIPIIHSFAWIGIESHILKLSWLVRIFLCINKYKIFVYSI